MRLCVAAQRHQTLIWEISMWNFVCTFLIRLTKFTKKFKWIGQAIFKIWLAYREETFPWIILPPESIREILPPESIREFPWRFKGSEFVDFEESDGNKHATNVKTMKTKSTRKYIFSIFWSVNFYFWKNNFSYFFFFQKYIIDKLTWYKITQRHTIRCNAKRYGHIIRCNIIAYNTAKRVNMTQYNMK